MGLISSRFRLNLTTLSTGMSFCGLSLILTEFNVCVQKIMKHLDIAVVVKWEHMM